MEEKLIQTDFLNGSVLDFFRHLALGMVTLT
jgi:hypothetical protein